MSSLPSQLLLHCVLFFSVSLVPGPGPGRGAGACARAGMAGITRDWASSGAVGG